jgi:hypothetical protein
MHMRLALSLLYLSIAMATSGSTNPEQRAPLAASDETVKQPDRYIVSLKIPDMDLRYIDMGNGASFDTAGFEKKDMQKSLGKA